MRSFLIATMPYVLWLMVISDVFTIIRMFREFFKDRSNTIPLIIGLLCIGLLYDSLILALGVFMKEGTLLKTLSQFRYIFHCLLVPLIFPICANALSLDKKITRIVWIVTAVIMVLGTAAGIVINTEARTVGDVTRYAQSESAPKWAAMLEELMNYIPVFLMMGTGIYLMIRKKDPYMFLAGFSMFLFSVLGVFIGRDPSGDRKQSLMFYISMFGEALMVLFLWFHTKCQLRKAEK